jgi:hypothetical protein
MMGAIAQAWLHSSGTMAQVDIAGIECRHAAIRRILMAKSIQSRSIALEELSADYFCRGSSLRKHEFKAFFSGGSLLHTKAHARRVKSNAKTANQPKPKIMIKGGGTQRAFFHHRLVELQKDAGTTSSKRNLFNQLHRELRQLSPSSRTYFTELGKAATISHSRGGRSFAKTANQFARRCRVTASGVLVAANSFALGSRAVKRKIQEAHDKSGQISKRIRVQTQTSNSELAVRITQASGTSHSIAVPGTMTSESFWLPCAGIVQSFRWYVPSEEVAKARVLV